jgi:predicted permease
VLSLAAGIGLTAALASVADAILYRPLPVPHPGEIVRIFTSSVEQPRGFVSFRDFEDFRILSRTVVEMTAQTQVLVAVGGAVDSPARVRLGLAVTADYFEALEAPPAIGRAFHADEWRQPVVVLSDTFWRSEYGADPGVIGRAIRLGGVPFTVIGIARKNFGLDRFVHESFYVPIGVYESGILASSGHPLEDRGRRFLMVYGRLASGDIGHDVGHDTGYDTGHDTAVQRPATIEQVRAEFSTLAARLEAEYPETNRGRRAIAVTELEARMGADRTLPALAVLLIALAALILTIAAANAGGLLLARAEARSKEIAVRMALGATHGRLLAASIREAGLLALAGAALGVPMAWAATKLLARVAALPTDFPFAIEPRMDARIILIAALASALAAIVCGCAPALAARRIGISAALRSAGGSIQRATWRTGLVVVEVALATALVATGAWLLASVRSVDRIDPGYRVDGVLTMALDPAQTGYTPERTRAFYDQLLERVRPLAGVKNVALAQSVVLGYTRTPARVEIDGEVAGAASGDAARGQTARGETTRGETTRGETTMWMNTVTPEYFALMRLPLVSGRAFDDRDTESSPAVAIVNQELAKRCGGPSGNAIGMRIRVNGRMVEVVGVARTAKYFDIHEPPQPYLYLPYSQHYASRMVLHIQTGRQTGRQTAREIAGDLSSQGHSLSAFAAAPVHAPVLTAVLHEIRAMDAAQPVSEIRPLRDYLDQGAMFGARVGVDAIGAVGACAMALALAGICGLISQAVRRRRREIGIRIALGATRAPVIGMVMRQAIAVVALGTVSGLALTACAIRLFAAIAPGTGRVDIWSAAGAAAVAIAGLAAALIPAWRASAIDPMRAFRDE